MDGLLSEEPSPDYRLFASGLTEIFGLAESEGVLFATQQTEVTRVRDLDGDGRADLFETVSDRWGFGAEHEFTYGSNFDRNGHIWVTCCLSGSYTSDHPFRGWCLRVAADGTTIATASGIRSPGGVGFNREGDAFYTENQIGVPAGGKSGVKRTTRKPKAAAFVPVAMSAVTGVGLP